jgi:hypothetical protein
MGWSNERFPLRFDAKYSFYSIYNPWTGAYYRSNVFDGIDDTGEAPFMASFPHLIDVGIMGHCTHRQSGLCQTDCRPGGADAARANMSIEDFTLLAEQGAGKANQFVLGGGGDAIEYENLWQILEICADNLIVPCLATSGYGLTEDKVHPCDLYHVLRPPLTACEGGRFSCYIDSDLTMRPCFFDQGGQYAVSLRDHTIEEAWNSPQFAAFREQIPNICPTCAERGRGLSGCPRDVAVDFSAWEEEGRE